MAKFDSTSQTYGRQLLTTNKKIINEPNQDLATIKEILAEVLPIHSKNMEEETKLFNIFFNDSNWWEKSKSQRSDINNKRSIPMAWALTRTLNGYCFGEPIKYIARGSGSTEESQQALSKQQQVERLSAMLDFVGNHDCNTMATYSASICGLGYKLCLPATQEEFEETGVPFVVNTTFIYPQNAGVVVSNEAIPRDVMGFLTGKYIDPSTGEEKGNQYTCWTKYHQFVLKESENGEGYDLVKQIDNNGAEYDFYPLTGNRIPLIEIERNSFRKGDWEVATDLLQLKNNLLSNREDDVQQIIDYVLVLMNCKFEDEDDKKDALKARLFELKATDPNNKPAIDILKNTLDQTGVQTFADYVDLIIQECVGIPNRQERGGGGGDTGQAVKYRNGFRDLENNAGFIIPKMEKAEIKFIGACINYCLNAKNSDITDLKPYDVRLKFLRSFNDDILSSSQAFVNYIEHGIAMEDSLIMSGSGTDPSEIVGKAQKAYKEGNLLMQWQSNTTTTTSETPENGTTTEEKVVEEDKKTPTGDNI